MASIDELVELAAISGDVAMGASREWLLANGAPVAFAGQVTVERYRDWSADEEEYLEQNLCHRPIGEIAAELGRSTDALRVKAVRRGFTRPRHAPDYLSANMVAKLLNVDNHKIPGWMDQGIMPMELFPYQGAKKRKIKVEILKRWLVKPTSWVYFDVRKIINPYLRRLVEKAQQRWGDEWLDTNQVAEMHGVGNDDVVRYIDQGRLPGFHAVNLGGRSKQGWSRWFVKRSEAEKVKFGDCAQDKVQWSASGDAFLLRMRAAGKTWQDIARLMKWNEKRAMCRFSVLTKKNGNGKGEE